MSIRFAMNRERRKRAALFCTLTYVAATLLTACGGGSAGVSSAASSSARPATLLSGQTSRIKTAHVSGGTAPNAVRIAATASAPGSSTFVLTLPAQADRSTLEVMLNGIDVTSKFSNLSCSDGVCAQGALTLADGARQGKNVLSALVKSADGSVASGRARFEGLGTATAIDASKARLLAAGKTATIASASTVCDTTNMCPPWLPPTVNLSTLHPGGWTLDANPWMQVNGQSLPAITASNPVPANCASAPYVAIVLDRQTLAARSAAPNCFADGGALKTFLGTLTASDLVIAGTTWFHNQDGKLDTSAVGGTDFTATGAPAPLGYMLIGAGQQAAGSAYEAWFDNQAQGISGYNVFASGILQEDANGNYNFQSSDVVQYAVSPNDTGSLAGSVTSSIILKIPPSLQANLTQPGVSEVVYTPPAPNDRGLWLMVLDRVSMRPAVDCTEYEGSSANPDRWVGKNCGSFYSTSNPNTAFPALAAALQAVDKRHLAILVSVNAVGSGSAAQVFQATGFADFASELQALGGSAYAVAGPSFSASDAYAFVGYRGAGNSLTGNSVESTTMNAAQDQSGFIHGTMQRDNHGLLMPAQSALDPLVVFQDKGGVDSPDFVLATAAYQQSTPWPSSSTTALLSGAASLDGQYAAYRFLSHWLLAGYYQKGIKGPHQDDIHYFFSGSTNTFIDYHTMDPVDLPFPGAGTWDSFGCDSLANAQCQFTAPGDSAASSFTAADFNAVKAQMSLEVQYLTNALQFLVTGSANMKNVLAAGNATVGLALTSAAATVLSDKVLAPTTTTTVSVSWQNILSLIGGVASAVANAEGLGELRTGWETMEKVKQTRIKAAVGTANTIGALLGVASSAGQIRTETTSHSLPSPYVKFVRTLSQLASSSLQNDLSIGFDVAVDNITSDWGRLSAIAPSVVDTTNNVFYAPNQVAQNASLDAIVRAASQSYYMALIPSFYTVQRWQGVGGEYASDVQPDMGYLYSGSTSDQCFAFYLNPRSPGLSVGKVDPTQALRLYSIAFNDNNWPFAQNNGPYDWYVLAGASHNSGKSATIDLMPTSLTTLLFAADQLNISMLSFVAPNGPMANAFIDAATKMPVSGVDTDHVCAAVDMNRGDGASPPPSTSTTLSVASASTLGSDVVLTATVRVGDRAVNDGSVVFVSDGVTLGSAKLDDNGVATFTLSGAALGKHQVQALYSLDGSYQPSQSDVRNVGVYAGNPDLAFTAAQTSLDVSYNGPSTPLALTIASVSGLSGDVKLSCSGLPVGMNCTFQQEATSLDIDGKIGATVVIGPTPVQKASALLLGLLLLSVIGGAAWRDPALRRRTALVLAASMAAAALSACGGGSDSGVARETGKKTVLVTATVGSVSRTVPIDVTIR